MTEAEWASSTDPRKMLESLRGKVGERRLRLFAVACCRRVWHLLRDERSRMAVEAAQWYAEGALAEDGLRAARQKAAEACDARCILARTADDADARVELFVAEAAAYTAWSAPWEEIPNSPWQSASLFAWNALAQSAAQAGSLQAAARVAAAEKEAQAALLRCTVGNPFRPVTVPGSALAWNAGLIPKLARAIYERHTFDDLPILADALEEAGCTDGEILSHLRGPGPHVRGCWCVDMLLAKE